MSNALLDFGTGAFSGLGVGAKVSGGNPFVTGAAGLAGGVFSLFGGSEQRGQERQANRQSMQLGSQQLRLNDLQISQIMREDKAAREAEKKKKMFGKMLGQWFANRSQQQGAGG